MDSDLVEEGLCFPAEAAEATQRASAGGKAREF